MEYVTILALAGIGLLITAILGGGLEVKEIKIPSLSKQVRIISAFSGICLLVAAYFINLQGAANSSPPDTFSATFEFPPPNTPIPNKTELRGTLKPVSPANGKYWIVLRDDDGDYFPQAEVTPSRSGSWNHSLVLGPAWRGRSLNALILFAPSAVDDILRNTVGKEGLKKIPEDGIVIADVRLMVEE